MGKKNSNVKTIAGAGIVITLVALTPLLLLFAGIEVPVVGKAYSDLLGIQIAPQGNPDEFMIQFVDEEMANEVGENIEDILEIGSNTGQCGFEQIDPMTGELPDCIGIDDGTNPPACINSQERIESQCVLGVPEEQVQQMIKEVITEFEETIPEGSELNQTQTSNDPPIEQIIDDITSATSLNLVLDVVKIDANNNRFETTITTAIPALAFFVEEETNIDFTNGFIEFRIDLETFANTNIDGSGKVDLLIANQTILPQPIDIQVLGTTNSEGRIDVSFISPTGATSDLFLFSFKDNMNKFPIQGVTVLELKLIDFQIKADLTNDFALSDGIIFTMNIATNPNEIIVTDEQAGLIRIFPTDDRFVIRSTTIPFQARQPCIITSFPSAGCTSPYCRTYDVPPSTRCKASALYTVANVPAPTITGINLFENGVFVKSILGGTNGIVFDEILTRNTNYTITIADPKVTFDFTTPKSQKNYDFKCWGTAIGQYGISARNTNGNVVITGLICPTALYCSALANNVMPPFRVVGKTCNFQ